MRNYFPYGLLRLPKSDCWSLEIGSRWRLLRPTGLKVLDLDFPVALQRSCNECVVVIAQTFLAIYALFRNMNYYDMNAPFLEIFFNAVKGAALKPCTAILGGHAIDVLCKKKGSEGET